MQPEKEWIQAICEGKESAFRELYQHFSTQVYNTAVSVLQHAQDAEDITQEVFIEIHKSITAFNQQSTLSTWIYRITVNKCYDQLKRQKTKKRFAFLTSLFNEHDELVHDKPHFEHPGIKLEHKEHAEALFKAMQHLSEKQKMAFVLNKIEGLSYQQVAEVMDISLSAVESQLFRANENLKRLLSDYYKKNIKSGTSIFLFSLLM